MKVNKKKITDRFKTWGELFSYVGEGEASVLIDVSRQSIRNWKKKNFVRARWLGRINKMLNTLELSCTIKDLHDLNPKKDINND